MNDNIYKKKIIKILPHISFLILFITLYIISNIGLMATIFGYLFSIFIVIFLDRYYQKISNRLTRTMPPSHAPQGNRASLRAMMIDGIEEPLILISADRIVIDANNAARVLFGMRMIGRDISLHIRHPDILDALSDVMAQSPSRRIEITLSGSVERVFSVNISRASDLAANDGRHRDIDSIAQSADRFFVLSMHDISQMKKVERMRADFVANASHELRTPLSSLIGFLETLSGPAKDDKKAQARFLDIMHEDALRMVRLIDDLLSLSRIELDKHLQPDGHVAMPALLMSVSRSLEPVAAGRQMFISLDIEDNLPDARGDSDQLRQVMQNLISNAIKYADKNSVVEIKAKRLEKIPETGEPGVIISVIDQGQGIEEQHIPRLTERFYRVDAARSRQLGGTGLGLAIVKHIVTRHRGYLDIKSTVGKGTTVTIALPCYDSPSFTNRRKHTDLDPE